MAKVCGVALSAIQVADAGFQLYGTLSQDILRYEDATDGALRLSDGIKTTSRTLQQLGTLLQQDDRMQLCRPKVVQEAVNALDECRTAFDEVQHIVGDGIREPVKTGIADPVGWLWLFEGIRGLLLLARLERSMTTMLLVFMVLSSAKKIAAG